MVKLCTWEWEDPLCKSVGDRANSDQFSGLYESNCFSSKDGDLFFDCLFFMLSALKHYKKYFLLEKYCVVFFPLPVN